MRLRHSLGQLLKCIFRIRQPAIRGVTKVSSHQLHQAQLSDSEPRGTHLQLMPSRPCLLIKSESDD